MIYGGYNKAVFMDRHIKRIRYYLVFNKVHCSQKKISLRVCSLEVRRVTKKTHACYKSLCVGGVERVVCVTCLVFLFCFINLLPFMNVFAVCH